jgi:hypothetical protein
MKYVYLLQEREFVTKAENVYKVGRTTQINFTRFNQYPKSSKLYFQRYCGDCHICEREIIALLTERYDRRIDVGGEYFEGDVRGMVSDMCAILLRSRRRIKKGKQKRRAARKKKQKTTRKKRQEQKIARTRMVERHEENKQKRWRF